MKFQSQHDLLDPDLPAPEVDLQEDDDPDAPSDAYVIGANGDAIDTTGAQPAKMSWEDRSRWAKPLALGLLALFAVMTMWNATRLVQGPPAPPKTSQFQTKQALYLGVMKIDAFRRVNGQFPASLTEAGLPEGRGYSYERIGPTQYVLSFRGNGPKLEYNSSDSKELFFGSPADMLTMGDSK